MPVDAFSVTKDPKDLGSQFLTKEEKAEIKAGSKEEATPKKKVKKSEK